MQHGIKTHNNYKNKQL